LYGEAATTLRMTALICVIPPLKTAKVGATSIRNIGIKEA